MPLFDEWRACLSVSETLLGNYRYRTFHTKGMHLMYTYNARNALREPSGDRLTYRASWSMQRSVSYTSSAVQIPYQHLMSLTRRING